MNYCFKISFCLLMLFSSGCVHHGRYTMARVWADWNTYAEPTICYERTDHLPYHPPRVDYFRWMYGLGPGETPVRIIHPPAQNVSYQSTTNAVLPETLSEPTPLITPAPQVDENSQPKKYPLPPPPLPELNLIEPKPKVDELDLIGYTTGRNNPNSQRTDTPQPRKSWMFSDR